MTITTRLRSLAAAAALATIGLNANAAAADTAPGATPSVVIVHGAFADGFLADGRVRDEGSVRRGRDAIAAWAEETAARYGSTIAPRSVSDADGKCLSHASVSGNFPGSPAMLAFSFVLQADGIDSLEITA